MGWNVEVDPEKFLIAVAPYGGPIALMRNDRNVPKAQRVATKPFINIYTSAGRDIAHFKWESGSVIHLAWSCKEDLLCIQDDGVVLVYDIFGNIKRHFSMGQDAKDLHVIECQVFNSYQGTGIAVLTTTYRLFVVNNIDDVRIRRLQAIPGMEDAPSCWAMLNRDQSPHALMASQAELFLLDQTGKCDPVTPKMTSPASRFLAISVSFNNKYLALFTDNQLLWIGSSDLQSVYCELDTKCTMVPKQLVWCGTGAVVGYWENILLLAGPKKDWIKYTNETPVYLLPEADGLRIIGQYSHEFLQRVPKAIEDILKIGSMASGALLYEAIKEFQKGSQRADEYIRLIRETLDEAVAQCIEAAGHEWEPSKQKMLLRAATFGKCFLTDYSPDAFVNMCQMLRVLNAVRDYNIGIPLTYTQLEKLTLPVLIDRLVLRRHYCLAIRICNYLKLPEAEGSSRILAHWACYKVQQKHVPDEEVAHAIASKLDDMSGVSYADIANGAFEGGRVKLALKLLDHEPKAAEQVPLLMKMKKDELALLKAIESGDTDLVYTVLRNLRENMPSGDFLMCIRTKPIAYNLFIQDCRQQNRKMLQDLYCQEDSFLEQANLRVVDSYDEDSLETRLSCLLSAHEGYSKAKCDWATKQTEEQMRLLRFQRQLEDELKDQYLDLSVHQTIYRLVLQNKHRHAENMRREFKVPERRYWWLKISALAQAGDWLELEKFSKSKKSPIGYEPFVEVCIQNKNRFEAQKYLSRVLPDNKVTCYIKTGQLEQAAEIAFERKNDEELSTVLAKCGTTNRGLTEKIHTMKVQLSSHR
ncbi:hypothetical protein NP493_123g03022 [Ridgeia piscesae]|uniref:Vacuolar protein sorting-associated protein 16 homolog n=1 Tax=Ridgeia piscesae TaxID=27915 RepID=A0AAD9UGS2_RIDPI|nr:hypothetical protein NP493_123g03022 [Ridgeia piscesae]